MIDQIKTAFKSNLPKLKWMDDETRIAAIDKVFIIMDCSEFSLSATVRVYITYYLFRLMLW